MISQTATEMSHTTTPRKKSSLTNPCRIEKPMTRSNRASLHSDIPLNSKSCALVGISKSRKSAEDVALAKERRGRKIERRRRDRRTYTAREWAAPAPTNLNARLDIPKVKTKYQSYFEITENPEKKEKKLEFKGWYTDYYIQATNDVNPPPGYAFVPIGDPAFTNTCKELSRENDAMVFIVSTCRIEQSKISEQVYRIGFHFRENIVETAREYLGESQNNYSSNSNFIEPIPESQEEINKQADAAIRDLFPRIPNTDRRMVIEHAFKKGAMFQGEPTVGTESNIPLSRRVQLAILAHIRHNHTRYDQLLRETSWINARKAVEQLCLDIILKWRGDEETGRDQMDEILREVVIISDSENEDEEDQVSESSIQEDDVISSHSPDLKTQNNSNNQLRYSEPVCPAPSDLENRETHLPTNDKRARRGFKRYQAAWQEALHRQQEPHDPSKSMSSREAPLSRNSASNNRGIEPNFKTREIVVPHSSNPKYFHSSNNHQWHDKNYLPPNDVRSVSNGKISGSLTQNVDLSKFSHPAEQVLYHDVPQRTGGYKYHCIEQPLPQVVAKHSPQDMLVKSIETAPKGALSCPEEQSFVSDRLNRTQDPNLWRPSGKSHQTPAHHQVIIIDDDSPEVKRRRMIYEDGFGHFRPLSPRKYDVASKCQSFEYPSKLVSIGQTREFLAHPLRKFSQYAQDLPCNISPANINFAATGRGAVHESQRARYVSPLPMNPRRAGAESRPEARVEHIDLTLQESNTNFDHYPRRLSDGQFHSQRPVVAERTEYSKYRDECHRSWSPRPYVPYQSSCTFDSTPLYRPIHNMDDELCHFPADGIVLRAKDHPTVISGREFPRNAAQPQHREHYDTSSSLFLPRLIQPRSPLRITERPMYSIERSNGLSFHNQHFNRPWERSPVIYSHRQPFSLPMDERHRL